MASPSTNVWSSVQALSGGLVVSCQASLGEPLATPQCILALSLSAINGGAKGLRLEGVENIQYVRKHTHVPIIGLIKSQSIPAEDRLNKVYITATFEEAKAVVAAGADIVAIDATSRPRPDGMSPGLLISSIHKELGKPVWADISQTQEGIAAVELGADVVSTTLYGYTSQTYLPKDAGPALELLQQLCQTVSVPVVLEGRIWQPDHVSQAFAIGAYAVVVGSAITRPQLITKRFVRAISSP
ncbi:MAG: N-acetylmannosamine-6-phosphate 2-epimerase [Candidatus Melainabacteria bacterium]|nr:N-acetylmannosamine-6-phosphate 2-epimerase [Candidatus Melainabacteria bacterium]